MADPVPKNPLCGGAGPQRRRWFLAIDGWTPPSVNVLLNVHWGVAHQIKKATYYTIWLANCRAGVPVATGRRRMSLTVTVPGRGKLPDPGNLLKVIEDALVHCKLLIDDSSEHYQIGAVEVVRGPKRLTVITLEDV